MLLDIYVHLSAHAFQLTFEHLSCSSHSYLTCLLMITPAQLICLFPPRTTSTQIRTRTRTSSSISSICCDINITLVHDEHYQWQWISSAWSKDANSTHTPGMTASTNPRRGPSNASWKMLLCIPNWLRHLFIFSLAFIWGQQCVHARSRQIQTSFKFSEVLRPFHVYISLFVFE